MLHAVLYLGFERVNDNVKVQYMISRVHHENKEVTKLGIMYYTGV